MNPAVVSLRELRGGRDLKFIKDEDRFESESAVVQQIERSLRRCGCVFVPVSDLDASEDGQQLLLRCYSAAESLFSLPEASKLAYTEDEAARQGYGGSCYTPLGKEPAYVEGEKQHVESFSCTRPLKAASDSNSHRHRHRGHRRRHDHGHDDHEFFHRNLFPDAHVDGFGEAYSSLWEALTERVTFPMITALEIILSLPRGFLAHKSTGFDGLNMSLLRSLHYPSRGREDNIARTGVGISEHTDFELITVMHQDSPGLWLKSPGHGAESRWYQPHFRPDVLTVILGDMAELWTAGWFEATPHKVISPSQGRARKSLVLFQAHDDLVKIHPLRVDQLDTRRRTDKPGGGEVKDSRNYNLRPRAKRARRGLSKETEADDDMDNSLGYFRHWLVHHPKAIPTKYGSTTQGAWVRENEQKSKSASLRL